jgi:putative transport protein
MEWLQKLFTEQSIAQAVVAYGLVIALGIWLGRKKILGISLGVTWVLFIGIIFSYFGLAINKEIEHFIKEFGLILFVYCLGLQVGPGFFASLKKSALTNNILAAAVVITGVITTIICFYLADFHISILAGVMSGAVTNTPGLAAAQAAMADLDVDTSSSFITLAYAVAYPFGVIGIILSLAILKKVFRIDIKAEQELHRKLNVIRGSSLMSMNLQVENKQMNEQPLRKIFSMLKEPIVVSRILHKGEMIVPTPDTKIYVEDVLLIVAHRYEMEQLKILVGPESETDLRTMPEGKLISRMIVVTRKEITHTRLGDIPELHQKDFTLTRLNRAGIDMVPNGNIILHLADTIKVVGTPEGVKIATAAVGNSLKKLEAPDLTPIFVGIVLGVILGSIPFYIPGIPVSIKIGMAGGPLIIALLLSRYGGKFYLNNYTTNSANLMVRELGIALFLASVGLASGSNFAIAFKAGGLQWILMGLSITMIPLLLIGYVAHRFFRRTYFETCGLLAGASTDPPALAFAIKTAGNDVPSAAYATVYPLTMILRILAAQLLILFFT